MTVDGPGPRPRGRDNGLRAATYAPVADLDPRVAEALLRSLAERGIAAYVAPTPGTAGPNLERRPPPNLTDRLWVDVTAEDAARKLVATETGESPAPDVEPNDEDAAWAQIVADLTAPAPAERVWPEAEDASARPEPVPFRTWSPAPEPEEHYEPPPPPPLPKLAPTTLRGLLAIIGGVVLLFVPNFTGGEYTTTLTVLGILAILGGVATLIWHMHDGPPTDSGPDDGAVV